MRSTRIETTRALVLYGLLVSAPTGAAAQSWPSPCERPQSAERRAAITAAQGYFEARWGRIGGAAVTAFTARPEAAAPNPFQLKAERPDPATMTVTGLARAEVVECTVADAADGEFLVEFTGVGIRFHEAQPGWSDVLARGRLMVLGVKPGATPSRVTEKSDFATVILPGALLRVPVAADVPPLPQPSRKK